MQLCSRPQVLSERPLLTLPFVSQNTLTMEREPNLLYNFKS